MSRPKPSVLLEYSYEHKTRDGKTTHMSEQVLGAEAIYAVFHDGKPINLRSLDILRDYPGPKYKKVSFSNPGHAFNLCERLNKVFQTNEFVVVKLTQGEIITERQ